MSVKPDWLDETRRPGDWIDEKFVPGAEQEAPPAKDEERKMVENIERRVISGAHIRAAVEGGQLTLAGHAATFGDLSRNMAKPGTKNWHERIDKTAFEKSLRSKADVVFTINHDLSSVLGRTKAGTLTLNSDNKGLAFRCSLPDTESARALHTAVMRGDMSDMSFSFSDPDATWDEEDYDGEDDDIRSLKRGSRIAVRTLRSCALQDVSCVTFASYPKGPSIQARAMPIVLATCPADLDPWFAEAKRRADMVAKIIEGERVSDEGEEIRQRRRALLNSVLS
jgi:HK97 family phage prohead protease